MQLVWLQEPAVPPSVCQLIATLQFQRTATGDG